MAEKLVALTFLLLFVSFQPVISEEAVDQGVIKTEDDQNFNDLSPAFEPGSYVENIVENSLSTRGLTEKSIRAAQYHKHTEEPVAYEESRDIPDEQAPTEAPEESKGSPGFFSQIYSELTHFYNDNDHDDGDSETPSDEEEAEEGELEDGEQEEENEKTITNGDDETTSGENSQNGESVDNKEEQKEEEQIDIANDETPYGEEEAIDGKSADSGKEQKGEEKIDNADIEAPSKEEEALDGEPGKNLNESKNEEKACNANVETLSREEALGSESEKNIKEVKNEQKNETAVGEAVDEENVKSESEFRSESDNSEDTMEKTVEKETDFKESKEEIKSESELEIGHTENVIAKPSSEEAMEEDIDSKKENQQDLLNKQFVFDEDLSLESADVMSESAKPEIPVETKGPETDNTEESSKEQEHTQQEPEDGGPAFEKNDEKSEGMEIKNGWFKLSDEELEHLRVKRKEVNEENNTDSRKAEELIEEQKRESLLEKERRIAEEQEKRKEDEEKIIKSESLKESADSPKEEEDQIQEEFARKRRLESLKEQFKQVEANEKKEDERQIKKKVKESADSPKEEKDKKQEEFARKIRHASLKEQHKQVEASEKKDDKRQMKEKVEESADSPKEQEDQRQEEFARKIRHASLKEQHKQEEVNEKKDDKRQMKKKFEKERQNSIKRENGIKVKDNGAKKEVPHYERVQRKQKPQKDEAEPSQENGNQRKKHDEEEEHRKRKGAFDKNVAEEAALKKKLEQLSEERKKYEKLAAEYSRSKQQREAQQPRGKPLASQAPKPKSRTSATVSSGQGKSGVNTQDRRPQSTRQTQKIQRTQVPPTRATIRDGEIGASLSTDAAYVTTKSVTASTMGVSGTETGTTERGKDTVAPGTSTSANSSLLPTASTREAVETKEESTPVEPVQRSVTDDGVPGHTDTKVESHPTVETKGTTSKATNHESEHLSSVHLVQLEEQIPKKDVHCADGFCRAKPEVISLASRFQQVEKKSTVGLVEPPLKDNASQAKDAPSGFANFMKGFRNFHEVSLQFILQYWPSVKNATKNLLLRVGLDQAFEQLCKDLADVHPAVLLSTVVFGTLGILYFFWSITFGRMRNGAHGPNPRDVLKSHEARVRFLEEEVESLKAERLKMEMDRNNYHKEKLIAEEESRNLRANTEILTRAVEKLQKERQEMQMQIKSTQENLKGLEVVLKEKDHEIANHENAIANLNFKIGTLDDEIVKLNDHCDRMQMEKEAHKEHIGKLNEKIEHANIEHQKLQTILAEMEEKKQVLQTGCDDQSLRLSDLQQQYEFKCNEIEVLKDCFKQIKLQDGEEEPDEEEMTERLQNLLKVHEVTEKNDKLQEKVEELEAEAEKLRRTNKMFEEDNVEKTERAELAESKATQALLIQREKEIELEALQKYFKSSEVELHRKITAEESTRISIENQLHSEQAKASSAVVDADKYRQLYLDIKKQIEEIDESKKEQLSNIEKKAHQNWLDYRAAVREVDGLKDENEILRRKLYDLEVRGSRPSSSASKVDGRDSPATMSPMPGVPSHGSPVPFGAPPMMGPLPPPSSMFPGQRRPHPADFLGMTPPRQPFPPPGPATKGHATPPPTTVASSAQSSQKPIDSVDSFGHDNTDGSSHPPLPLGPMAGFGPPPSIPPMMRMPRFPPPPMMHPSPNGPLPPPMFLPRPGGPMPPPPQGTRPQASSTPNRS